uniref:Uncharacterized protein n=1 Tax=Vespula pensylvanica TaxID=30213 RepID=A0A834KXV9_VESPE|nr:hypothetical protein H0235_012980 [Vespula pensylvanica]
MSTDSRFGIRLTRIFLPPPPHPHPHPHPPLAPPLWLSKPSLTHCVNVTITDSFSRFRVAWNIISINLLPRKVDGELASGGSSGYSGSADGKGFRMLTLRSLKIHLRGLTSGGTPQQVQFSVISLVVGVTRQPRVPHPFLARTFAQTLSPIPRQFQQQVFQLPTADKPSSV